MIVAIAITAVASVLFLVLMTVAILAGLDRFREAVAATEEPS
jgi:hypothetical protein